MGLQLPKRARRVALWGVLSSSMLLLGACSKETDTQIKRLAEPIGVTDRAPAAHHLWMGAWLAAILVGILVWGLIGYASVRYRRRSDDEVPVQIRYHLPLEILYTVAPVIMVVVFFYQTVQVQDEQLRPVKHPQHVIDVVGQQWSWTFNYVKDKSLDGKTTVHSIGTTAYEPTLYLPVGQTVRVNLSSPDVIHDFWVPAFLFKMDIVPGRHNHFSFTPTRKGTFKGHCAELCGTYHSRMIFNVKIVSPSQYAAHLRQLEAAGNTGLALGGSEARTQAGLLNAGHENGGHR